MNVFSNNDIFDYIIDNIHSLHFHVLDYKKLRKVSVNFSKKFNIRQLFIETKKYDELMRIDGFTYKHILDIIEKDILCRYNLKKKKSIILNILQHSKVNLHIRIINSKSCIYIEYFLELLYNSSYKKHRNVIKILNNIKNDFIHECSIIDNILNIIGICLDMFNYIKYMNGNLQYKLNISMVVFIILKVANTFFKSRYIDYTSNKSYITLSKLFILQNQKLKEYKEDLTDEDLRINKKLKKTFPKYYLKYVVNLIDDLYII